MRNTLRFLILPVLNAAGPAYVWLGLAMLAPLAVSLIYKDGMHNGFYVGILVSMLLGFGLTFSTSRYKRELRAQHGFLLVTMIWATLPLISTIPLLMGQPQYSFAEMYYEAVSCLTTTGGTVMSGLDQLPLSLNGWRHLLSWMGGMGLIVLAVAILPLLGVGGAQIMKAEVSGPMKESKLTPRIADTAKALYAIYLWISIACTLGYRWAGMSWADAIMHMMTTVSLSGISAHDSSYMYWNSPAVDWVAAFFMWICGFNFALHYLAWKRRTLKQYFVSAEALGWTTILASVTALAVWVLLSTGVYDDFWTALRYATFSVVSVASTTGYADTDFSLWPLGLPVIMLMAACCACSAGSPGGGLKMIRIVIMLKQLRRDMKQLLYPNAVVAVKVDEDHISTKVCLSAFSFIMIWILTLIFGTIVLMLSGMPAFESFAGTISNITNLGMSLGKLGPSGNYSWLSDFQLYVCSFLMLAGRLELYTLFVLFTGMFWRV